MTTIRSRIPIDLAQVNMIISEDVIDYKGTILIPKDTVMTEKHIYKLEMYNILSIVIKDPDGTFSSNEETDSSSILDIDGPNEYLYSEPKSPEFKAFKEEYTQTKELTKKSLLAISNGDIIQTDDLYHISTTLADKLNTKSTLFNYMYDLHDFDDYTYSHSINVSLLANIFAGWLGYTETETEEITVAGLLHDIGKTKIDPSILNKPGKLTDTEFEIIKHHAAFGYEILRPQNISNNIKAGVLMHHERIDGSGYPLGFKSDKIHEYAKVLAICDIYDAMTSVRSYHQKISPFKVIKMFEEESYGLLSTEHLFTFLNNIAHNYIGCEARLSNNESGKIIFINPKHPSKPLIQTTTSIIDLSRETGLAILDLVQA